MYIENCTLERQRSYNIVAAAKVYLSNLICVELVTDFATLEIIR